MVKKGDIYKIPDHSGFSHYYFVVTNIDVDQVVLANITDSKNVVDPNALTFVPREYGFDWLIKPSILFCRKSMLSKSKALLEAVENKKIDYVGNAPISLLAKISESLLSSRFTGGDVKDFLRNS